MNLDDIIDAHASMEEQKTKIEVVPITPIKYRCEEHSYSIEYFEELEKAKYTFDGQTESIETDIPLKQRNYYVDSGYWSHATKEKHADSNNSSVAGRSGYQSTDPAASA